MGDRANLYFRTAHKAGIGVYAHSSGPDGIAKAAMAVLENKAFQARGPGMKDQHYATRIGVQLALKVLEADPESQTGFGLWTPEMGVCDNSYGICVIDVCTGKVYVTGERGWDFADPDEDAPRALINPTAKKIEKAMRG